MGSECVDSKCTEKHIGSAKELRILCLAVNGEMCASVCQSVNESILTLFMQQIVGTFANKLEICILARHVNFTVITNDFVDWDQTCRMRNTGRTLHSNLQDSTRLLHRIFDKGVVNLVYHSVNAMLWIRFVIPFMVSISKSPFETGQNQFRTQGHTIHPERYMVIA